VLKSVFLLSYSGCLIPLLLAANLLFGWVFLSFRQWLLVEAVLFSLLLINSLIFSKKSFSGSSRVRRSNVIDVEGQIIDEKPKKDS
jgi:hypothetical protein